MKLPFFFAVLVLELRAFTLSHSTGPFLWRIFQDRVSGTICLGLLWTTIILISASLVATITGMSHQCLAQTMKFSSPKSWVFFVCLFSFRQYWGLNSGSYTCWKASVPALFWLGIFRNRGLSNFCPGWLHKVIFLISASWVATISGVSHQHQVSKVTFRISLQRLRQKASLGYTVTSRLAWAT
jgi:hypothetical protein